MTFTIDQVKRLVPEGSGVYSNGIEVIFTIGHVTHGSDSAWGKALLTTRSQLAIAREALQKCAEYDWVGRSINEPARALDAIAKEGNS